MSVTTAVELSRELHRLAIAGVGLADGDRRIAALLPALERSAEKVPVFVRIAERTRALLGASKGSAAAEFLALNTLVGAVLKTQGQSGVDGELSPLPPATTRPARIPARALAELRDGLYGGRTETLRDAFDRGWFGDVRLAPFALEVLHSDHAELANFAARKLVPAYGRGIVPLLVASLDLSRKRPASRLIETVRRVDAGCGAALARQILDPEAERVFALDTDGVTVSDEARAAALGCLGDDEVDGALLADSLDAKRKPLRVAALSRLLALGDADAEGRAVAMLGGSAAKAREAFEAIPALSSPALAARVLTRARELARALDAKSPAQADVNDAARVLALLVRSAPDPERFEAALALFERIDACAKSMHGWGDKELPAALEYLIGACPEKRRKTLARNIVPCAPNDALLAAIRALGPLDALAFLKQARKKDFHDGLENAFGVMTYSYVPPDLPPPTDWSVEWLALALSRDLIDLVDHLWALDPALVVGRILARRKVEHEELAIAALIADPGCAAALRRKLDARSDEHARLDALCAAVADGARGRALELLDNLHYYGLERVATLRDRLTDHLPEATA